MASHIVGQLPRLIQLVCTLPINSNGSETLKSSDLVRLPGYCGLGEGTPEKHLDRDRKDLKDMGIPIEEISLTRDDGEKIKGWYISGDGSLLTNARHKELIDLVVDLLGRVDVPPGLADLTAGGFTHGDDAKVRVDGDVPQAVVDIAVAPALQPVKVDYTKPDGTKTTTLELTEVVIDHHDFWRVHGITADKRYWTLRADRITKVQAGEPAESGERVGATTWDTSGRSRPPSTRPERWRRDPPVEVTVEVDPRYLDDIVELLGEPEHHHGGSAPGDAPDPDPVVCRWRVTNRAWFKQSVLQLHDRAIVTSPRELRDELAGAVRKVQKSLGSVQDRLASGKARKKVPEPAAETWRATGAEGLIPVLALVAWVIKWQDKHDGAPPTFEEVAQHTQWGDNLATTTHRRDSGAAAIPEVVVAGILDAAQKADDLPFDVSVADNTLKVEKRVSDGHWRHLLTPRLAALALLAESVLLDDRYSPANEKAIRERAAQALAARSPVTIDPQPTDPRQEMVSNAIERSQWLRGRYRSTSRVDHEDLVFRPERLRYRRGEWFIEAHCKEGDEFRARVLRLNRFEKTPESFDVDTPDPGDFEDPGPELWVKVAAEGRAVHLLDDYTARGLTTGDEGITEAWIGLFWPAAERLTTLLLRGAGELELVAVGRESAEGAEGAVKAAQETVDRLVGHYDPVPEPS